MSERKSGARHRAACRPSTPLTTLSQAITGGAGRRAFAVVASSGLALTMGASTAAAVPHASTTNGAGALTNLVLNEDSVSTSPTVTVAANLEWSFDAVQVSSQAPPPPPPPPPVVAPTQPQVRAVQAPASRSGERTQAPQQATQASAEQPQQAAPASGSGSAVVSLARRYIGTPYSWGGGTPAGFDCSGFTSYVFAQFGVSLPRSSAAQRNVGRVISAAEARPGDIVWWSGHVGIYTGNGNHIAARNPSKPLTEGPIWHVGRGAPVYIRVID